MAPSYFPSYGSGEVPVGRRSGCCAAIGTAGAGGLGGLGGGAAGVWIGTGPGFGTGAWTVCDIFGLGVFGAAVGRSVALLSGSLTLSDPKVQGTGVWLVYRGVL